jgi:hypothetical protein
VRAICVRRRMYGVVAGSTYELNLSKRMGKGYSQITPI